MGWDDLSNTYALYRKEWNGCYIEGDPTRFRKLQRNVTADRVAKVNAFVAPDGENSFDRIMTRINAPREIDLLSIDIDSDDLAIWRSVSTTFRKSLLLSTTRQSHSTRFSRTCVGRIGGNSALSLVKLGEEKGYDLVCAKRQTKS